MPQEQQAVATAAMPVDAAAGAAATAEDEEMDFGAEYEYNPIEKLQTANINVADINKLKEQLGAYTITAVLQTPVRKLLQVKGFSDAKVEKIREAAKKIQPGGFRTGGLILEKRSTVHRISTGSEELNKALGGGIDSQALTEVHGEARMGKTQLMHTLAITAQMPNGTYTGGKVIYIDTENTFRPERLEPICDRFNIDYQAALDNIYYLRAFTTDHMFESIVDAATVISEEPGIIKLVIIDSIMALFRVDYSGRGELSERQCKLNQVLAKLQRLAEEWNLSIVMTNQMTADPGNMMAFGDPKKPIGGHVLAHATQTRLYMKKGRGDERIVKLVLSPMMPEVDTTVVLTNGGVCDVD